MNVHLRNIAINLGIIIMRLEYMFLFIIYLLNLIYLFKFIIYLV